MKTCEQSVQGSEAANWLRCLRVPHREAAPVVVEEAAAPGEPMDINAAVKMVLKKALAHDGLCRGLHEACRCGLESSSHPAGSGVGADYTVVHEGCLRTESNAHAHNAVDGNALRVQGH